ncbi:MAG: hypothetical protein JSR90_20590 [Proteobacteria bacterium]|nr:hypothetical protein [Pseudomonadota bacterium]
MRSTFVVASTLVLTCPALAAGPEIDVRRGEDRLVYGSCVPSLAVENGSAETIDYLEIDLLLTLADGTERQLELQSAYREGIHYPIAPGNRALLQQHLDTSPVLGVPCDRVKSRKVMGIVCQTAAGSACATTVSVVP